MAALAISEIPTTPAPQRNACAKRRGGTFPVTPTDCASRRNCWFCAAKVPDGVLHDVISGTVAICGQ